MSGKRQREESPEDVGFTINKKFAESFERRKRREEIIKAKEKAKALKINPESESEESDSESEDSDAELLTKKANAKFMKAIYMIRKKDPKLKDPNYKIFSDSDFDTSSEKSKDEEKPIRYKELISQEIKKGKIIDEDEIRPETKIEEQKRLKDEFKAAANSWKVNDSDEILSLRKKTAQEIKDEEAKFQEFVEEHTKFEKKEKKDLNELKEFWLSKKDKDEEFLKNFVINRMWKDEAETLKTYDEIVDVEDEKNYEEAEKFEHVYNYRFEEEGAEKIITHSRQVEGSVRLKDNKRKEQRENLKERKMKEKIRKEEEIKRLKNLKRQELQDKLKLIKKMGGIDPNLNKKELEEDFDPDKYDKLMDSMYGEDYYEEEEENYSDLEIEDIEKNIENAEENAEEAMNIEKDPQEKSVQDILKELKALDYEDMIGDMPCKFKYRQVDAEDYGLNDDDILNWDDAKLNQLVSLKKLAPYREDQGKVNKSKIKKKKKFLEKAHKSSKKEKHHKKHHKHEKQDRFDSYKLQD
ncbi:kri1 [Blepharisma stoltei]|uniref:Kri1-like C-terminal domain-containing protein n=1 Tax=Blepharisma stoltei TaxID=1481888 RepID=A0AAU9IVT2_9CILI|nr:unnamed protein product [Blepharisma stoltei]